MKGLIICASGVTSKMIATKIEKRVASFDLNIKMDAIDTTNAVDELTGNKYDFYLVSPQASFKFAEFSKLTSKPIDKIKPTDYVPVESNIDNIIGQITEMI